MKAMVLKRATAVEENPLEYIDIPDPDPAPGEILIRVRVCGICRTDLHTVEGEILPSKMPIVPGHQVIGTVAARGPEAKRFVEGDRVGMAWLFRTCGVCSFCLAGKENLCEKAQFTGFDADGGFAEYTKIHEDFAYPIPDVFTDREAAPLLCAGIIGYRALRLSEIQKGQRLGLYGFGAAAHIAVQVAVHRGCEVYVFTRGASHRALALRLGASWAGSLGDSLPAKLQGSIIFAPAGEIVPVALSHLDRGGTLALGGIYMTPIPALDYMKHLYDERTMRSVTASTRRDGNELLEAAAEIPIRTEIQSFPLAEANRALQLLKAGRIDGAGVLVVP
ncbi:MAG TPA: zinc-dependent alcohol dehydrogenase family protein [Syntrophales bacterium]|nr:zinc-dependent alcohol dehydrogenase family protein [Syntrophales bacterium]HRT60743.1 zinc-dependent alcohol dehydrogenase family protein [Syntrophales bacterium]